MTDETKLNEQEPRDKRSYTKPTLKVFGAIQDIVKQGPGAGPTDEFVAPTSA